MRQQRAPRPSTFEDLYAEHAASVLALIWLLGVERSERADVAQEVWLTVFRTFAAFDGKGETALSWLGTITRNAVRDWRRTRRRRPEFGTTIEDEHDEVEDERAIGDDAEAVARRDVMRQFLFHAVPDEDRREAFVLHEFFGLTVNEVAAATGVRFVTAQWRLKMARSEIRKAMEAMSEADRERLRAVVLPLGSIEALVNALRREVPEQEVAEGWSRLSDRIASDGLSVAAPPSAPPPAGPGPAMYFFTARQIAGGLIASFIAGAATGAAGARLLWPGDRVSPSSSIVTVEPRRPPPPPPSQAPSQAPAPPSATTPPVMTAPSATTNPSAAVDDQWLCDMQLDQMRRELGRSAERALEMANRHAKRFPKKGAAEREEIVIHALLLLHRDAEAEERVAKLLRSSPSFRPKMEDLFGRTLP